MHFSAASILALSTAVTAVPFHFPLPNGFPNPNASAIARIQTQAGGTLPNTPTPPTLKADAIQTLRVIALNEIFEVSYFTTLLRNVTNDVPGFTKVGNKSYVIASLTEIRAQEELHALGANAILKGAGQEPVAPCEYQYPVTDYLSAISLAATFTDVVLGTLQGALQTFALDGGAAASGLVPLLGSIIGQEGEQVGAYRLIQGKVPSASPFLTGSAGPFALNAVVQNFIVPGSCDSVLKTIGIPLFQTLTPVDALTTKSTSATFKTPANVRDKMSIVYISGQNSPVVEPITSVVSKGGMSYVTAAFPFKSGFSKGLTIAALTNSAGPFANNSAVAAATIAGPGLIEID